MSRALLRRALPLLALLTVAPGTVAAQGRLLRAELTAELPDATAPAEVRIRYHVLPGGQKELPLAALRFGSSRIEGIAARWNDVLLEFSGLDTTGSRIAGNVQLPETRTPTDSVTIDVAYTVFASVNGHARVQLPVLAVLWPPAEARPGTFVARLTVPDGYTAYDALPSHLRTDATGSYATELSVLPAVVSFSITRGTAPRFSLRTVLNGSVLLALAIFVVFAWRNFRAAAR